MTAMDTVRDLRSRVETLQAVYDLRKQKTLQLAEANHSPVGAANYELSLAIERVCREQLDDARGALIRARYSTAGV